MRFVLTVFTFSCLTFQRCISNQLRDIILKEIKDDIIEGVERDLQNNCDVHPMFAFAAHDIDVLLSTLRRMTDFWKSNHNELIVDGLLGMRAAQGVLERLVDTVKTTNPFYARLKRLQLYVKATAGHCWSRLREKNSTYTNSFTAIVDKPLKFSRKLTKYRKHLVWDKKQLINLKFNETYIDHCFRELLGSNSNAKCTVTDRCMEMLTRKFTQSYYLTHQALYLMFGETNGCHRDIVQHLPGGEIGLDRLYEEFGSNIYAEMRRTKLDKRRNWDIFAEQGFICQMFGISECFRMDGLREALQWVNDNGCVEDREMYRVKRYDRPIGRCSQHMTSVTMGYLASHLRFMFHPPRCELVRKS